MGTKTITIMDDAYTLLVANKARDESFSEEIRRTFSKKRGLIAFAGAWKEIPDQEIARMKAAIEEGRKSKRSKEILKRI